jgi:hypothetical protein
MEYVEGRSLRDILRDEGPLPAMTAARITAETAAALDFAHRHGVIHRDVKPGNVLITASGQVKVADFGIAANPTDAKQGLTQTGSVIGTATYFSPEQDPVGPLDAAPPGRVRVVAVVRLGLVLGLQLVEHRLRVERVGLGTGEDAGHVLAPAAGAALLGQALQLADDAAAEV